MKIGLLGRFDEATGQQKASPSRNLPRTADDNGRLWGRKDVALATRRPFPVRPGDPRRAAPGRPMTIEPTRVYNDLPSIKHAKPA